ncbi:MAG: tRNA 5-methoxyuridine(34)/uridine 5-oxyacetic acid(34) synthase CmoB [Woeseiaceae bacterium]
MLDEESLCTDLESLGLAAWESSVLPLIRERLANSSHGDLAGWKEILNALPDRNEHPTRSADVRSLLLKLTPWRKGPFDVHGITIDAEWRSDLKWARLIDHIEPLQGRKILDVGSGNGWYAMQMLAAGAKVVVGIDPTILFVVQFEAIRKLNGIRGAHVLPLRLEDLPANTNAFDSTFSMGVLYHRRDPAAHLTELYQTLKPGGELVLETLVLPGDGREVLEPKDRYARMRNVWHLPCIATLEHWVVDAGFVQPRVIDISTTTTTEQRSTEWMPFESLAQSLDPENPELTVEGLPAPTRAVMVCRKP